MDLIYAIVIGVVQGVSEWLPISSKTQVMLVSNYIFGAPPQHAYSLGLFMEAASVLAAVIYFRHVYRQALRGLVGDKIGRKWLLYMAVTTLATAALGVPLYYLAKTTILAATAAGWLMAALGAAVILNGLVLRKARRREGLKSFTDMSIRDMALVGIAQAISVLPGLSRSGTTTTTLLLLGYKPDEAFKASFVLVPIAGVGAATLAYLDVGEPLLSQETIIALAVGVVASLVTIDILMKFARGKHVALVNIVVGSLAVAGGLLRAFI